jgi:hypothetical protein
MKAKTIISIFMSIVILVFFLTMIYGVLWIHEEYFLCAGETIPIVPSIGYGINIIYLFAGMLYFLIMSWESARSM